VKLGPLNAEDLDAALALSAGEEWNQSAADWSRLLLLEPSGCFGARDGSRLVGTVTTLTYGRALAWIGMMVVHPEFRRQGIGAALMRLALDYVRGLGIASVKLDATPAGRPLYESLGFTVEAEVERWQGVAHRGASLRSRPPHPPQDAQRILLSLDQAAYGTDRSRLLKVLIADSLGGPLVVESEHGLPAGYALARQGRTAAHLGPLIATSGSAASQLLDGMLERLARGNVCLDLHRHGWLEPGTLAERGLSKRRGLVRMSHGLRSDGAATRSICASAGPELG
jgi:GNAT superfamily N-acetyltransferase